MVDASTSAEAAYYYPQPYWIGRQGDGMKSLLLFFDEIAILLPQYMKGVHVLADPVLAGPMADRGLLRVLEPETFIDQQMAEDLATAVVDLLTCGVLDDLEPQPHGYQELSQSRLGWNADIGLATMLIEELQKRDLARPSEDGVSIPLHPGVRTTVLVLLAQLARAAGRRQGMSLHPITPDFAPIRSLTQLLSRSQLPSAAHIVSLDLEAVSVNLDAVPLDEIIDFRQAHGKEYRGYMRDCRQLLLELGPMPPQEREEKLQLRREELQDRAHLLRRATQRAWARTDLAVFSIGLAGAAWELVGQHDPISAAIVTAAAGITAAGTRTSAQPIDAYSYMFRAEESFASR